MACMPDAKHCITQLIHFQCGKRTAGHQHKDDFFAQLLQFTQQHELYIGNGNVCFVVVFSGPITCFAAKEQNFICIFCLFHGFGKSFCIISFVIASVCKCDFNARLCLQCLQRCDDISGITAGAPHTQVILARIRQRTRDKICFSAFQGQRVVLVFQQDCRLCRSLTGQSKGCRSLHQFPLFLTRTVRMFKQSQCIFDRQDACDTFVNFFHDVGILFYQFFQVTQIYAGGHIHVITGQNTNVCGILIVCSRTVVFQFHNSIVIGNNKPFKAHTLPQHFRQIVIGSGNRFTVQAVERAHGRHRTGVDGALICL